MAWSATPASAAGHSSLASDPAAADAIWIAVSVLLLAVVVRHRRCAIDHGRSTDGGLAVPAMFCLWSLLVDLPQRQQHDLDAAGICVSVVSTAIQPSAVALDSDRRSRGGAGLRRAGAAEPRCAGIGWIRIAVEQFDRVLVLGTLAYRVDRVVAPDVGAIALEPHGGVSAMGCGRRAHGLTPHAARAARSRRSRRRARRWPAFAGRYPRRSAPRRARRPQIAPARTQKIGVRSAPSVFAISTIAASSGDRAPAARSAVRPRRAVAGTRCARG